VEFDWDEGNQDKNLAGHGVNDWEIEEALQDELGDGSVLGEFRGETRREYLGRAQTSGRYLKIIYTIRSARRADVPANQCT
jgi:uncharacterized DUF497 family protein